MELLNKQNEKKLYVAPSMEILEMKYKGCMLNCTSTGYNGDCVDTVDTTGTPSGTLFTGGNSVD